MLKSKITVSKTLFYCYLNKQLSEFSTACVLLSHSAMASIKAIYDFINLSEKTLAHCEEQNLEEIRKFIAITNKKKDEDGVF